MKNRQLVNFSFKKRAQQCRQLASSTGDKATRDQLNSVAAAYETWDANPQAALEMARRVREANGNVNEGCQSE
jgi:hypothetical protein